jgi:small subunit ribosomal protein S1
MSNSTFVDMDQLLQDSPVLVLPKPGDLVKGVVVSIDKSSIIVDLDGVLTGIVAGREMKDAMNSAAELEAGHELVTCVLETENDDGLVILSLRRASQEKTWERFLNAYENDEAIEVVPKEANKGGLLLNADGIKGFIPVSQLAPLNYPRVNGADSAKILARLGKLVDKKFLVKIISIDKENGKLILSERAAYKAEREKALTGLGVGEVMEGTVSGIVKFGIFVAFGGLEGLVHISEIAWGHVTNPHDFGKRGDKVKVKIIGIDGDKISLSMKQLTKDPWDEIEKKFTVGKTIKTKITRLAQFGAFVKVNSDINGLIHNTEIPGQPEDPTEVLKVGQEVDARVIEVKKSEKRIGLTLMPEGESPAENGEPIAAKPKTKKD